MSSIEVKKKSRGLGLPARAAAVAAAMVQAIVTAALARIGLVATGRLTEAEAGELARSIAAACQAAFTASGSKPQRERSGELVGKAVCVKLSPRLERAVSREASKARVSVPCWLRWAASEQLRLERAPLEPGEQERLVVKEKKKVEEEAEK